MPNSTTGYVSKPDPHTDKPKTMAHQPNPKPKFKSGSKDQIGSNGGKVPSSKGGY